MIELNTTWNTVTMLLIAAGVGLLGGIAAGLIEMQRSKKEKEKENATATKAEESTVKCNWLAFWSSVFIGGVAAVAILYFFPPQEVVEVPGGESGTMTVYSLSKLVALALIVGSAGSSFLLVMQNKTLALAEAKEEVAAKDSKSASVSNSIGGLEKQVPEIAKSNVEASATPTVTAALEAAKAGGPITADTVAKVVEDLGSRAQDAVKESIEPVVQGAQATMLGDPKPELAEVPSTTK
jgi:hypothetical protein